jgi:hypothetical protein
MTGSQTGLRLRKCGPREPRSTRSRRVFRNAYLLATAMRAKFALRCRLSDRECAKCRALIYFNPCMDMS